MNVEDNSNESFSKLKQTDKNPQHTEGLVFQKT